MDTIFQELANLIQNYNFDDKDIPEEWKERVISCRRFLPNDALIDRVLSAVKMGNMGKVVTKSQIEALLAQVKELKDCKDEMDKLEIKDMESNQTANLHKMLDVPQESQDIFQNKTLKSSLLSTPEGVPKLNKKYYEEMSLEMILGPSNPANESLAALMHPMDDEDFLLDISCNIEQDMEVAQTISAEDLKFHEDETFASGMNMVEIAQLMDELVDSVESQIKNEMEAGALSDDLGLESGYMDSILQDDNFDAVSVCKKDESPFLDGESNVNGNDCKEENKTECQIQLEMDENLVEFATDEQEDIGLVGSENDRDLFEDQLLNEYLCGYDMRRVEDGEDDSYYYNTEYNYNSDCYYNDDTFLSNQNDGPGLDTGENGGADGSTRDPIEIHSMDPECANEGEGPSTRVDQRMEIQPIYKSNKQLHINRTDVESIERKTAQVQTGSQMELDGESEPTIGHYFDIPSDEVDEFDKEIQLPSKGKRPELQFSNRITITKPVGKIAKVQGTVCNTKKAKTTVGKSKKAQATVTLVNTCTPKKVGKEKVPVKEIGIRKKASSSLKDTGKVKPNKKASKYIEQTKKARDGQAKTDVKSNSKERKTIQPKETSRKYVDQDQQKIAVVGQTKAHAKSILEGRKTVQPIHVEHKKKVGTGQSKTDSIKSISKGKKIAQPVEAVGKYVEQMKKAGTGQTKPNVKTIVEGRKMVQPIHVDHKKKVGTGQTKTDFKTTAERNKMVQPSETSRKCVEQKKKAGAGQTKTDVKSITKGLKMVQSAEIGRKYVETKKKVGTGQSKTHAKMSIAEGRKMVQPNETTSKCIEQKKKAKVGQSKTHAKSIAEVKKTIQAKETARKCVEQKKKAGTNQVKTDAKSKKMVEGKRIVRPVDFHF